MNRALFIDRDGVLNEVVVRNGAPTAPRNWDEVRFFAGYERLSQARELGFLLILVTNQPDLERGIVAAPFVEALHEHYRKTLGLDAVFCCPFSSNDHPLKKPNPGMFLQAAKDFSLDLPKCYHLGDTDRDTVGAARCGCKSILIQRPYNLTTVSDHRVESLEDVIQLLKTFGGK